VRVDLPQAVAAREDLDVYAASVLEGSRGGGERQGHRET
jgi:hypothetical protein